MRRRHKGTQARRKGRKADRRARGGEWRRGREGGGAGSGDRIVSGRFGDGRRALGEGGERGEVCLHKVRAGASLSEDVEAVVR